MTEPLANRRLNSWKEIAAYLKRDERTAMRWASERGLPVHRVPGPGRGSVFAWTNEIDAWLNPQAAKEPPDKEPPRTANNRALRRRLKVALAAGLLIVAAGTLVYFLRVASSQDGTPNRVLFSRNSAQILNTAGEVLWSYTFPGPIVERSPNGIPNHELARIVDLDGDGRREVVLLANFKRLPDEQNINSVVYCFSAEGRLLWQYKPNITLAFAGREFGGPWWIYDILISPDRTPRTIWLALAHRLSWPSFVAQLDLNGNAQLHFINAGTLNVLAYVQRPEATYLLAGGINSELGEHGALAVLDPDKPGGMSPADNPASPYRCRACPPGRPVQYFLFPRSELNRVLGLANNGLLHRPLVLMNTVEVTTWEVSPVDSLIFSLAAGFRLQPYSVGFSTGYERVHEQLEREGKLDHTAEQCPERFEQKKARMWTPESGWAEVFFATPQGRADSGQTTVGKRIP